MSRISELTAQLAAAIREEREKRGPAFASGDSVAWSHEVSTQHAQGSIVRRSAILAQAVNFGEPLPRFGTIVEAANEEGTQWVVDLEVEEENAPAVHGAGEPTRMTLTSDELVKVQED